MTVTIKEIAREAGVSTTTVSYALRSKQPGRRPLAKDTISRVKRIAEQLGYRPNHVATSLVNNKTNTIGVLLSNLSFGAEELLDGIKMIIAPEYSSLLSVYNSDGENERMRMDMFMQQRVDGMLAAFSGDPASIPYYQELTDKYGIPIVLIDRGIPGLDLPVVRSDHLASTYEGTRALQRLGHKRIQYASVSMAHALESTQLRLQGYCDAMNDAGLGQEISFVSKKDFKEWVRMDNLRQVARGIIDVWSQDKQRATALFVDNDWLAYEIIQECMTYGFKIPEDLSLMGIGDYVFSGFSFVALSTVSSQKQSPMGKEAGKLLMSILKGNVPACRKVILPVEVKLRSTTQSIT